MPRRAYTIAAAIVLSVCAGAQEQALREAARLDGEGKCEEAEPYYRQALAKGAPSAALLNNAGNHYLVCGQAEKAKLNFEALLKINPAHQNANLQLGRMAVNRKEGMAAQRYLAKVNDAGPAITLLRAEALHWSGKPAAARSLLENVAAAAKSDPRILFTLGVTAARIGEYERAEAAFSAVAVQVPGDFDVLFNLGRAAARAGHDERAAEVLEAARTVRPREAGVLLELGRVHAKRGDSSRAVYVLAQARAVAPGNAEVLLALAHAAEDAGYAGDSVLAFDEYLALRPEDDRARLDRARVYVSTGTRREEGIRELQWYVGKHPSDPVGHFTMAQFVWETQPETALEQLTQAVRVDPGFAAGYYARAWLLQRLGRIQESLPDLEATAKLVPGNVRALDQLGLAYLALGRPMEAEKTLRRALAASPTDREALMHLGRALMEQEREAEAQPYFERFLKTAPQQVRDPRREAGMIELATLPADELARRQTERLRKEAGEHPDQPELQLRLAQLLLADGRWEEAQAAYRELASQNADSRIWEEAGTALVRAERYELAIEFLKRAVPERPGAYLELGIALYFSAGPGDALQVLEQAPESERGGDYLLLKARLLDESGRKRESEQTLQAGLRLSASRPQVARQAALLLLSQDRPKESLALLERAIAAAPANADLPLMRATVLGLLGRVAEADKALVEIESRWPEWDRPYLAHGLLLERARRSAEAKRKMQTALALNAQDAGARCGVARLSAEAAPEAGCSCWAELRVLLFPACEGQ